uniref:uncharacterized protein LOC120340466 n=1 Tax=Styela clava TaxID=7725 RepID=UPI00193AD875|nr:uncharacterized protein LOC120340466 [Styela clava]
MNVTTIICLLLISEITANYKPKEEFVHSEFFERFDKKISLIEASKFKFPKQEGFVSKKYPKCDQIRYTSGPDKFCSANGDEKHSTCGDRKCTHISYYGSTKCDSQVKLFKPFKHYGVECKTSKKTCGNDKRNYGRGDILYPDPHRSHGSAEDSCECQTIWCLDETMTIYEKGGKLFKGNVTVKTPCKCECRRKFIMMGPYGGGGK